MLNRHRWFYALSLVILAFAAYFYFTGKEYQVRISEEQIRERLAAKMPIRKDYFIIFEVTLDNPRVVLVDGTSRIRGGLDVTLNIGLKSEKLPIGGSLDISGGVRYQSESGEFFIEDPVIEKFAVQGIPQRYQEKVNQVLTAALGEYYAKHPIYTLNRFDFKQGTARLLLKKVIVEAKQLVLTLGV